MYLQSSLKKVSSLLPKSDNQLGSTLQVVMLLQVILQLQKPTAFTGTSIRIIHACHMLALLRCAIFGMEYFVFFLLCQLPLPTSLQTQIPGYLKASLPV